MPKTPPTESSWQGDPVLMAHRRHLVSNSIREILSNEGVYDPPADPSVAVRSFYRSSGRLLCNQCGLGYRRHPPYPYDYALSPHELHVELCNGDVVDINAQGTF